MQSREQRGHSLSVSSPDGAPEPGPERPGVRRGPAFATSRRTMSRRNGAAAGRGVEPGTGTNGQRPGRRGTARPTKPEELHDILELSPADQLELPTTRRSPADVASGELPTPGRRARRKPRASRTGEPPAIHTSVAPVVPDKNSVLEHEAGPRTSQLEQGTPPRVDAEQPQSSDLDEAAAVTGRAQSGSAPALPCNDLEDGAPRLYTPEQAARLLQIPASWLRKRAAAHTIAHTRIGRHLRFSTADLHALVQAGQHPPAEQHTESP